MIVISKCVICQFHGFWRNQSFSENDWFWLATDTEWNAQLKVYTIYRIKDRSNYRFNLLTTLWLVVFFRCLLELSVYMPSRKMIEFVRVLCLKVLPLSFEMQDLEKECRIAKVSHAELFPGFGRGNMTGWIARKAWICSSRKTRSSFVKRWLAVICACTVVVVQHYAVQSIQKPAASYHIYSFHSICITLKFKEEKEEEEAAPTHPRQRMQAMLVWNWSSEFEILTSKWNQTWERKPGCSEVVLSHSSGHGNAIRRSYQKMWGWLRLVAYCTCPRQNFLRATVDSRELLALVWAQFNLIHFLSNAFCIFIASSSRNTNSTCVISVYKIQW